jgi:hypothetical protein
MKLKSITKAFADKPARPVVNKRLWSSLANDNNKGVCRQAGK